MVHYSHDKVSMTDKLYLDGKNSIINNQYRIKGCEYERCHIHCGNFAIVKFIDSELNKVKFISSFSYSYHIATR